MTFVPPDQVSQIEALEPKDCPYCQVHPGTLCGLHQYAKNEAGQCLNASWPTGEPSPVRCTKFFGHGDVDHLGYDSHGREVRWTTERDTLEYGAGSND